MKEALMVALPSRHPLARHASISLRQLAHERYIMFPRHFAPGLYDTITSAFQGVGISLNIVEEADHIQLNLSLIAMGDGVSVLPESLRCLQREGVTYLPLRPERLDTELGMVYRRKDDSPALMNFIRMARDLDIGRTPTRKRKRSAR
jgi:DNA-binding transcriptional LysR family regulator